MSDPAGPTGTATGGPEGAPQGTPPAGQTAAGAPTGQQTGQEQQFIQVQRDQLAPYGYDTHKALELANIGRQAQEQNLGRFVEIANQVGMTPTQLADFIVSGPAGEESPTPPTLAGVAQPPPTGAPLTAEHLQEILDKRDAARVEQDRRTQQEQEQQRATDAERKTAVEWCAKAKHDSPARSALGKAIFTEAVLRVIENDLRSNVATAHLAADPDSLRRMALGTAATESHLAGASKMADEILADYRNEIISGAAAGQEGMPSATLGGGAGGAQPPPKSADQMTPQERYAAVMTDYERNAARLGG